MTGFGPNFEQAGNLEEGDAAGNGETFVSITPTDDGQLHFVVSNGDEFDKAPDELVYSPKDE